MVQIAHRKGKERNFHVIKEISLIFVFFFSRTITVCERSEAFYGIWKSSWYTNIGL